ncbi:TetR/AcrR family transcriptional regulator [Ornithinimicrobium faecis]|uniref:TetR/AcrR family transcriptional regulator n=1 Tax=Ornithinimicrobium faecis TaxID=2934158 RepID=UPI002118BA8A|nr:TetR/AcrR family transcriptional regulator [Ornithinimicrobium sp. HY1745]
MTRHHDAADRKRQVGDALMEVVAERGLTRTTLRQVADTAGVSVGLVQRYFTTKNELLRFGFDYVYQRTRDRINQVPQEPPIREVVLGLGEAILPLDPQRRRETNVFLAFVHATLNDPDLADTHQRAATELVDGLQRALEAARRNGELKTDVDTHLEALTLVALLDGLVLDGMATQHLFPEETLRSLLHRHVDRLFRD